MVEVVKQPEPKFHQCTTCKAELKYGFEDVEGKWVADSWSYTIRCPNCLSAQYVKKW